jgi:hypothetical protein
MLIFMAYKSLIENFNLKLMLYLSNTPNKNTNYQK